MLNPLSLLLCVCSCFHFCTLHSLLPSHSNKMLFVCLLWFWDMGIDFTVSKTAWSTCCLWTRPIARKVLLCMNRVLCFVIHSLHSLTTLTRSFQRLLSHLSCLLLFTELSSSSSSSSRPRPYCVSAVCTLTPLTSKIEQLHSCSLCDAIRKQQNRFSICSLLARICLFLFLSPSFAAALPNPLDQLPRRRRVLARRSG